VERVRVRYSRGNPGGHLADPALAKYTFIPLEWAIRRDHVVPIKDDGRVVRYRVQPEIVSRVLTEEAPEALEKCRYRRAIKFRTLVSP
jgi:hypothetical protein